MQVNPCHRRGGDYFPGLTARRVSGAACGKHVHNTRKNAPGFFPEPVFRAGASGFEKNWMTCVSNSLSYNDLRDSGRVFSRWMPGNCSGRRGKPSVFPPVFRILLVDNLWIATPGCARRSEPDVKIDFRGFPWLDRHIRGGHNTGHGASSNAV